MSRRTGRLFALLAVAGLVATVAATPAAAASHAPVTGSGSSWAANAVNQWIADVKNNQGLQVVFTSTGSAQGRKDFANRSTDFGVTDIAFQGTDPVTQQEDSSQGRGYAYLPIVAGGTSFPYNLTVGGERIRNLRLSGETLAKIFTSQIKFWDDAAIAADNNGQLKLPHINIIPVVHSEGSGSTAQFTRYMAKQYPNLWGPFNHRKAIQVEYFPAAPDGSKQKNINGSDGVMNFLTGASANGAIGYDEYSYALNANFPVAKVLNTAGYYTAPTQYNDAVALTKAVINEDPASADYLTQNLDSVYVNPDPRTYPISSYSYMLIPTDPSPKEGKTSTTAARQTLADFLFYSICAGQKEMGPIGYSPLPINLVQAGFSQIGKLKAADPGVDLVNHDVTSCNNPTFTPGNPNDNHLSDIAPQPPACDKSGAGPCAADTGIYNGNNPAAAATAKVSTKATAATGPAGGTSASGPAANTASIDPSASTSIDPLTGEEVAAGGGSNKGNAVGTPTELASSPPKSLNMTLSVLAVLLVLSLLVAPVTVSRVLNSRKDKAP